MVFLKQSKTNWKYIFIVVILAVMVGGGTLGLSSKLELPPFWVLEIKNIEHQDQGNGETEIKDGVVIIRNLGKDLILEKIEQGKEFLLRMENEDEHGFYKKYDAENDDFENRLHTVYSASIIYTLLKIYDFDKDERISEQMPDWADFLLSMQSKEEETYGAFHYSYYLEDREKELKFVVGTTALTIFTLLDLYTKENNSKYLEAAKLGGDWLITMQNEDGIAQSYKKYRDGKWVYGQKESLLYNGQVLSALSRLYKVTKEEKYLEGAQKIANHFITRVAEGGCYLGDDYRNRNPISSAWVVIALLDFYRVNPNENYKGIILNCSSYLLKRQLDDPEDVLYHGRWDMAHSTSGNGWLAEVMMEMYHFCQELTPTPPGGVGARCDKYKEAVVKVIRWLIQNTYSKENTSALKNPEKAIGGLFWNYKEKYIRTDSVCHALNAYLGIINDLKEDSVLRIE